MNIKRLEITNFLGIGHGIIEFEKRGLVLVEGDNRDSPSSISNGAGKSSIYDALHWALWGTTKRGVKGDEVINNRTKKNCVVKVDFDNYRIFRARKDEKLGTHLVLHRLNEDGTLAEDMTGGTMRDTQEAIERLLKMSELTFSKIAHFGQGDVKDFAELSDAELKEVFEQALGLDFISECASRIREYKAAQMLDIKSIKRAIELLGTEKGFLQEKIDYLKEADAELRVKLEAQITTVSAEIAALSAERVSLTTRHDALLAERIDKSAEHKAITAKIEELNKVRDEVRGTMVSQTAELARLRHEHARAMEVVNEILARLSRAGEQIGKPCATCGKLYTSEDMASVRENLAKEAREASKRANTYKASVGALTGESEAIAETLSAKIEPALAKLREQASKLAKYTGIDEAVELLVRQLHRVGESIEIKKKTLETLKATDPAEAYAGKLKEAQESLERLLAEAEKHADDITTKEEELELVSELESIFGNSGLKGYVMDTVTPELNRLVDGFIRVLDDIQVEVSTVSKLKSGETREKFSISVNNLHGASCYAGHSGGEKQKVNLAISLAFNSLVRSMAANPLNCLFLDEPFESLDEGSSEKVLELCAMLNMPNIFIITHNPAIKDLIPNRIMVCKTDGSAKVV